MEPIFVRTRWHYQSYDDYWRLVELSGFPTCYVDEVDVEADRTYVVCPLNGEWTSMMLARVTEGRMRRATLVSWTLEPPTESGYLGNLRRTVDEEWVDWIWIGYRNVAQQAAHPRIVFAPVGSAEDLGNPQRLETKYDVAHLSYETHRRRALYGRLASGGIRVAPNGWGSERDVALRSSRFLLNVHKEGGFQAYEPLRFALAAAYGLPIISESCADPYPYQPMQDYYETSYEGFVDTVRAACGQDYGQWAALGQRTREKMTGEYSFRNCVEGTLWQL